MIAIIGESASGKSSIERALVNNNVNLKRVVSYTTRPIRKDETNGVDYNFVTKEKFEKLKEQNFFAEEVVYNNWNYAASKESCKDNSVIVVEPHGLRQLKKIKDLDVISFYIKVPWQTRIKRLVDRGGDMMEIIRRIISDTGLFQGIEDEVSYVIENDDTNTIDQTVINILCKLKRED